MLGTEANKMASHFPSRFCRRALLDERFYLVIDMKNHVLLTEF